MRASLSLRKSRLYPAIALAVASAFLGTGCAHPGLRGRVGMSELSADTRARAAVLGWVKGEYGKGAVEYDELRTDLLHLGMSRPELDKLVDPTEANIHAWNEFVATGAASQADVREALEVTGKLAQSRDRWLRYVETGVNDGVQAKYIGGTILIIVIIAGIVLYVMASKDTKNLPSFSSSSSAPKINVAAQTAKAAANTRTQGNVSSAISMVDRMPRPVVRASIGSGATSRMAVAGATARMSSAPTARVAAAPPATARIASPPPPTARVATAPPGMRSPRASTAPSAGPSMRSPKGPAATPPATSKPQGKPIAGPWGGLGSTLPKKGPAAPKGSSVGNVAGKATANAPKGGGLQQGGKVAGTKLASAKGATSSTRSVRAASSSAGRPGGRPAYDGPEGFGLEQPMMPMGEEPMDVPPSDEPEMEPLGGDPGPEDVPPPMDDPPPPMDDPPPPMDDPPAPPPGEAPPGPADGVPPADVGNAPPDFTPPVEPASPDVTPVEPATSGAGTAAAVVATGPQPTGSQPTGPQPTEPSSALDAPPDIPPSDAPAVPATVETVPPAAEPATIAPQADQLCSNFAANMVALSEVAKCGFPVTLEEETARCEKVLSRSAGQCRPLHERYLKCAASAETCNPCPSELRAFEVCLWRSGK